MEFCGVTIQESRDGYRGKRSAIALSPATQTFGTRDEATRSTSFGKPCRNHSTPGEIFYLRGIEVVVRFNTVISKNADGL